MTEGSEGSDEKPFSQLGHYYDLIYRGKDYQQECDLILEAIERYSQVPADSLLDVGCGTGAHLECLVRLPWRLHGIDASETMIDEAKRKFGSLGPRVSLSTADARRFDLNETFAAVSCMFAVFGYLGDDVNALAALRAMRRHLRPGGVVVLDVWYGPAVLAIGPQPRVLEVSDNGVDLIRRAKPTLDAERHRVRVRYDVTVRAEAEPVDDFVEVHEVRFFFAEELERLLSGSGFETVCLAAFPTLDVPPNEQTWSAVVVGRAV